MSDAVISQQDINSDEWDYILNQLEHQENASTILKETNAAFAAQYTQPDAYQYIKACDRLKKLLDSEFDLDHSQQKLVVQILQVACAMHENAVNNPALTVGQRSGHQLASASLAPLCKSALESGVTHAEFWFDVLSLSHRADQALSRASDALELSKYLDFSNMKDDCFYESGDGGGGASAAPSPVSPVLALPTPRASVHDITDVRQAPRPAKLKGKALVMSSDWKSKGAPLGRAHTMPNLLQTTSSSGHSRTMHSRGHGLHALREQEE